MQVLLFMSVFWIAYGTAGLFGFQQIPSKYRGYPWTKDYIRHQGVSWLMLGLPLLAFYLILTRFFADPELHAGLIALIVLILGVPSVIFTILWEKKYKTFLDQESKNAAGTDRTPAE